MNVPFSSLGEILPPGTLLADGTRVPHAHEYTDSLTRLYVTPHHRFRGSAPKGVHLFRVEKAPYEPYSPQRSISPLPAGACPQNPFCACGPAGPFGPAGGGIPGMPKGPGIPGTPGVPGAPGVPSVPGVDPESAIGPITVSPGEAGRKTGFGLLALAAIIPLLLIKRK